MRPLRVGVYADVNLNLIDGSAVWLTSLVETLHRAGPVELTVLAKAPEERDVLSAAIRELPSTRLVTPGRPGERGPLGPEEAVDRLVDLDRETGFDLLLLRGEAVAVAAAERSRLRGRLWIYVLGIPPTPDELPVDRLEGLERMAGAAARLLCQTEEVRAALERLLPEHATRMALLPMMVPDVDLAEPDPGRRERPRRLFYAGKFSPLWGTREMLGAHRRLRERFPDLELHVVGDKIHDPSDDPDFRPEVASSLESAPGVVWHRGRPRAEVLELMREADLALSVRHPTVNDSLEMSTKVLEYGARGVPVVLNRTPMYERLLGADYPFFVDSFADVDDVVALALCDPERLERARAACRAAAERHTFAAVAEQLAPLLEQAVPAAYVDVRPAPPRVLLASHELKFFTYLEEHLRAAGVRVDRDPWRGHEAHDEGRSRELLAEADVIVCEWMLGNAVWYARHRHSGQRLLARLHRVELETEFPRRVDPKRVDTAVVIAPWQRQALVDRFGWPADRITYVPNGIDQLAFDRPKLPGAEFNLGLVGYVPIRKRLDRALDLVERLRVCDPRFRLYLKGKRPWELDWVWRDDDERAYFRAQFDRIRRSPLLRGAVTVEEFGHVPSWMRKIGWILSVADAEGSHVGLAEGMAARCVPIARRWEGITSLYPSRWVYDSTGEAARAVLSTVREGSWRQQGEQARAHGAARWSRREVARRWLELVGAQP